METQLEIDTMNAVPTPRFDVGENTLAAQLLSARIASASTPAYQKQPASHSHNQRKQAKVPTYNQEERKVPRADAPLDGRREDDVPDERRERRRHDVEPAVARAVAVPRGEHDEDPSHRVRRDGQALRVDRREPELVDELRGA